jgi:cytoskeletal protein CcmA (bactofilin family)
MKKFLFLNHGQTLIEYALVLSFFAAVFTVSIPPLRIATVDAINRITDQLNDNLLESFPEWPGEESGGGSGGEIGGGTLEPWLPPELSLLDNNVIYSADNIVLQDSSQIVGNVVTNGVVVTSGTSSVTGDIYDNANYNWNFPLPEYPEISSDSFTSKGSYTAGWWPAPVPITEDGYYTSLKAVNTMVIDTGNAGDVRTLVVDDFELSGSGKINLQGEGKLILVVKDDFKFTANTQFNFGGLPENVMIYYSGTDPLTFGQGHIVGSVYSETTGITFNGSTSIKGNIIVGGDSVSVASGNVDLSDALLYAPVSNLKVTGSSSIEGRIIANSITGTGNVRIKFKPIELGDEFFWDILNP